MPGPAPLRSRRRLLVAATMLLALVVVPTTTPTAAETEPAPLSGPVARAALPDPFTGTVDDFYVVPDPLPPGARGELIRMQAINAGARTGWRVMYHTVDQAGNDRAVTGIITLPAGAAPEGGWPVVAHAHGTTGIAAPCAPSRGPSLPGDVGIEGVWAQTDYIGLGPVGELHPYLQRAAEANAVLDSVRAAHEIAGADLNDDWYLLGGSQGGHAALATYEEATAQLPDLRLVATVALVPGAETTGTFGDPVQVQILAALILFGNQGEGDGIDLHDVFTPEAYAALEGPLTTGCLDGVIAAAFPFAATDTMLQVDLDDVPEIVAWRERNEVARVRGASPIFVAGGVQDIIVVIDRVRALRDSLCAIGQPLTYVEVPDGDHGSTGTITAPQWRAWFQDRMAGVPLDSDCPELPTTTTTEATTTTIEATTTTAVTTTTTTTAVSTTTAAGSATTVAGPSTDPGAVSGAGLGRTPTAIGATAVQGSPSYTG